mgnify:CR=1 FL=1
MVLMLKSLMRLARRTCLFSAPMSTRSTSIALLTTALVPARLMAASKMYSELSSTASLAISMMISAIIFQDSRKAMIITLFAEISLHTFKLKRELIKPIEIRMSGLALPFIMLPALPSSLATVLFRSTALRFGRSDLTASLTLPVTLTSVSAASPTSWRSPRSDLFYSCKSMLYLSLIHISEPTRRS